MWVHLSPFPILSLVVIAHNVMSLQHNAFQLAIIQCPKKQVSALKQAKYFFPINAGQIFFAPVYWSQNALDFYDFGEILDRFQGGNLLFGRCK